MSMAYSSLPSRKLKYWPESAPDDKADDDSCDLSNNEEVWAVSIGVPQKSI
jgi:hypothetical protein